MLQIIGKGGLGREVASYTDGEISVFENECNGIRGDIGTIIAIGDGEVRRRVVSKFPGIQYTVFNAGQKFGKVDIGEGSIICPGTKLTTDIKIGKHVLINLNCTIGHDCVIGDYASIAPGVNICGNVTIGDGVFIGANAVIREKVNICRNAIIGAGAVIVKDVTTAGLHLGAINRK
jgi:sugar O-acyltransferase (sialic acid O-acetyltransferase NeuD family)